MSITSTPGALFVVGGRAYVDSQTLHNLARTHTITPLAGGWRVKVRDACASWLAEGAARVAGKFADWPGPHACGCGPTCGCEPCKQRHGHTHEEDHP